MHFITISRKLGSCGTEIANKVAESLGYKLIDTEAIDAMARKMGFLEAVEGLDEKPPSFFTRIFTQKPHVSLDRLNSVIYELAEQGDTIFVGRGGHILLKSFECALHVRITASRHKRIANLLNRGYSDKAAVSSIDKSDHERGGFIRFAFGVDWENPELYDIVLNTDKLDVPTAVQTITNIARSDSMKSCSLGSLSLLANMALASRAEAAIIEAGLALGQLTSVNVSVEKTGVVLLTGIVADPASKSRAEKVVMEVEGVTAVDNQVRVAPADRHA